MLANLRDGRGASWTVTPDAGSDYEMQMFSERRRERHDKQAKQSTNGTESESGTTTFGIGRYAGRGSDDGEVLGRDSVAAGEFQDG